MKKLITKLNRLIILSVTGLMGFSVFQANGQAAPWCDGYHLYNNTTNYSTTSYIEALEQVRISSGSTILINVPADGFSGGASCGTEWRLGNTTGSIDIVAGNSYYVESSSSSTYNYAGSNGVFIDFNNDKDFLDAGEYLGAYSTSTPTANTPGPLAGINVNIPCNIIPGNTRLRVVCNYYGYPMAANYGCHGCSGAPYYGETMDFNITLVLPTSVNANFISPTDAWVKTVVTFINSNQTGYVEHAWDANNDGSNEQKSVIPNFKYTWATSGAKCVKLRSTNCLGKDSTVKCLNINNPTAVPIADFIATRTTIEQYEDIQISDLSLNGPWQWDWNVYDSGLCSGLQNPATLLNFDVLSDPYGEGLHEFSQNPKFAFYVPGIYTVTLRCRNDIGWSSMKQKVCYITVTQPTQYNLGYGTYGVNNDNRVQSPSGTIFDNGGPNLNYGNGQGYGTRSFLSITPCNAEKIHLTMTQLKFKDPSDVLAVYDADHEDETKVLAKWNSNDRPVKKVTATSGSMFIIFKSDGANVDSGFAGSFTSELAAAPTPTPNFEPSTTPGYNSTPLTLINTTTDLVGVPEWSWSIDGNFVNSTKNLKTSFTTDGQYDVCLEIKSCVGRKTTCKTIDIVTPNTETTLDFTASTRRPSANITAVTLTPMADKANRFSWTIFPTSYTLMNPPGSPSNSGIGFINYKGTPGDSMPTPILKFLSTGCYTFTLKAWNSLDSINTVKTVVKDKYICAVEYCSPNAYLLSGDVGINRVKIFDGSDLKIDNITSSGISAYSDFSSDEIMDVTYGRDYTVEVSRNTAIDAANRKGWIDWNIDGDFIDAGEEIFFEPVANTQVYSATFSVPDYIGAFEGLTRMRLAINYNNNSTTPCGPLTAGEYEDYGIRISNDMKPPVLTLIGNDTVRIEKCFAYSDAGATAFDASEGDITSRIVKTSDLDSCTNGIYTIEYNVTDASGNRAVPVRRVIIVVNDLTKPILTLNPANPQIIEADRTNAPYVDPGATATDNVDGNLTSAIVVTGSVDTRALGTYILTYYVQDVAGNVDMKTRTVIVQDTKAPVIQPTTDEQVQILTAWNDQTYATDAFDNQPELVRTWGFNGQVNTSVRATYPATYVATDQSGNTSVTVTRNYRVDDFVPPVINLNTFDIVYHDVRTPYVSIAANATDNYYSSSSVSLVRVSHNVNPNVLGTYQEVFRAEDASGNVTVRTRTIIVRDNKVPTIWAPVIHGCVGENINPMHGLAITDNYYDNSTLLPLVEVIANDVNVYQSGVYSITYRVTDPSGNISEPFQRFVHMTYWPECRNSTSISDLSKADESINAYPNPSTGVVTIDFNGATSNGIHAVVYNNMGQAVSQVQKTEATTSFEIDLSGYAAGMYSVKIYAEGETFTKRILIAR